GGRVPASEGYGMDRTSMDFGRWGMWIARQLHFLCAAQNGSEVGAAYFYSPTKLLTALSTRSDAVRASALHRVHALPVTPLSFSVHSPTVPSLPPPVPGAGLSSDSPTSSERRRPCRSANFLFVGLPALAPDSGFSPEN
ncbi:unnamed protein product, partial [Prorocentrum cordatum]